MDVVRVAPSHVKNRGDKGRLALAQGMSRTFDSFSLGRTAFESSFREMLFFHANKERRCGGVGLLGDTTMTSLTTDMLADFEGPAIADPRRRGREAPFLRWSSLKDYAASGRTPPIDLPAWDPDTDAETEFGLV